MGICIYCKQKAWFLRNKHKECQRKHDTNTRVIKDLIETTFVTTGDFKKLAPEIEKLAKNGYISEKELNDIYVKKYDIAVQQFLYDGILTKEEEKKLIGFKDNLHIDRTVLNQNGLFEEFIKILIIKNLAEKKALPKHICSTEEHDINLEKNEKVIRSFKDGEIYRGEKTSTNINKTWFKTKSFEEPPAEKKGMKRIGKGDLAITEKHIYFNNKKTSVKINIKNIKKITPYEDGIGIHTDQDTRTFKNVDGRFAYNIIYNLNN